MLPEDWKEQLASYDAIYFGAVGDPATVRSFVRLTNYVSDPVQPTPTDHGVELAP
jgi:isocitrate/isopropylmalate dehydrogenase